MMQEPVSTPGAARLPGDERLRQAQVWLTARSGGTPRLIPLSGDASFRRYFRVLHKGTSQILMDAPPERENSRPFIDVAARLRRAGLHAPEILDFDLELGFGLLEDLGDVLYRERISVGTVDREFPALFDCLETMALEVDGGGLPEYDAALLQRELDLFTGWYLERHRRLTLASEERNAWEEACAALLAAAAEQPQSFVHRDFHSCNLLYRAGKPPGIIDIAP